MNAIATKFKVGTAAVAIAAGAAFAPAAANAAPAVQVPAAPVQQVAGDLQQAPGDLLYFFQVVSLQVVATNYRFASFVLESRAERLQAYAAAFPNTFFGRMAAASAERLTDRRARLGELNLSVCRDGSGISVGPYGTVTSGSC